MKERGMQYIKNELKQRIHQQYGPYIETTLDWMPDGLGIWTGLSMSHIVWGEHSTQKVNRKRVEVVKSDEPDTVIEKVMHFIEEHINNPQHQNYRRLYNTLEQYRYEGQTLTLRSLVSIAGYAGVCCILGPVNFSIVYDVGDMYVERCLAVQTQEGTPYVIDLIEERTTLISYDDLDRYIEKIQGLQKTIEQFKQVQDSQTEYFLKELKKYNNVTIRK